MTSRAAATEASVLPGAPRSAIREAAAMKSLCTAAGEQPLQPEKGPRSHKAQPEIK